jgi:hypothetical protein
MIRWISSWFAWEISHQVGFWEYSHNLVTGQRAAKYQATSGYQPLDWDWLDAGAGHPLVNDRHAWRSAVGQMSGRYC